MYTVKKPEYTARILKNGTIKTTYRRSSRDRIQDAVMLLGAGLLLSYWIYQVAGAILHFK